MRRKNDKQQQATIERIRKGYSLKTKTGILIITVMKHFIFQPLFVTFVGVYHACSTRAHSLTYTNVQHTHKGRQIRKLYKRNVYDDVRNKCGDVQLRYSKV